MKLTKTSIAFANECRQKKPPLTFILLIASLFMLEPIYSASSESQMESYGMPLDRKLRNLDGNLPIFEQTASNVTAFEGQTVYLPCRVHNLGDKVVSWMRSKDLHILTSDNITFSSDERFKLQHLTGSDAWTLQLNHVKKSDIGRYECQVNTEPKIMYAVQLIVRDSDKIHGYDEPQSQQTRISYESTAPVAAIMGPREQRVQTSSTITLKCVITSPYQTRPIKGVQWFRDNKLLTFQANRGGINVETVTGTAQTFTEVTLANVTWQDSGKYTCRPTEGKADTIMVYVENGEHTEAMQRDTAYTSSNTFHNLDKLLWLITVLDIFINSSIYVSSVFY
ncbi:PREDICTED: uncharacterized protein LOC105365297 [Ceratosolen solmsi marchali]|uniref:Uncharacterized protein LOC105365297 n=1 Tax=Ceratosolen solmsi marchali TaxID=326594 RepID=A0AAJ6YPB8_9HYME|nr:PREDICTED: uncharacterized protein LOC105365297 [Ceratosolen solmsi marchali]